MQIFQKSVSKEGLNSLIVLENHVYGIPFFDGGSPHARRLPSNVIENYVKFQSLGVANLLLSDKQKSSVGRALKLVLFGISIPPYDEPLCNLEEVDDAVSETKKISRCLEFYSCKIHLNKAKSIGVDFSRKREIVELYYRHGYPSAAIDRLIEFMNRVMGVDLPGEDFPNYNFEDLLKIAAHINQENFNFGMPRADAIPKYEIGPNGRPAILG